MQKELIYRLMRYQKQQYQKILVYIFKVVVLVWLRLDLQLSLACPCVHAALFIGLLQELGR